MRQKFRAFKPSEIGHFAAYYNFYKHITPKIEHDNQGVTGYFTVTSIKCSEDYCIINITDNNYPYTLEELYNKYQFINIQTKSTRPIGYNLKGE